MKHEDIEQEVYIDETEENEEKSEVKTKKAKEESGNSKANRQMLAAKKIIEKGHAKVKVKIMPSDSEKKIIKEGKKVPDVVISLNGFNYQIQKGVEVEIPENVAAILREAEMI